jgi:hypothetical protein
MGEPAGPRRDVHLGGVEPDGQRELFAQPENALQDARGSVQTQRGRVYWQGDDRRDAAGGAGNARSLGTEDGRARFTMGSGKVTFHPVPSS